MLKPPSQTVPGMTDTLEFVKNLWGGMNVPGMGMPGMGAGGLGGGLSTDELDKRITDLKAVESWLNLNLSMLRTSIQAMEVQRGTIAALKSMSDSMTQALSGQGGQGGDQTASLPPFSAFFTASGAPEPGSNTPGAGADPAAGPAASAGGASGAEAAMPAAVAWWNLLQDQFRQAVASAMPPDGAASTAAPEAPAAREQPVKEPTDMGARTTRTKADKS